MTIKLTVNENMESNQNFNNSIVNYNYNRIAFIDLDLDSDDEYEEQIAFQNSLDLNEQQLSELQLINDFINQNSSQFSEHFLQINHNFEQLIDKNGFNLNLIYYLNNYFFEE